MSTRTHTAPGQTAPEAGAPTWHVLVGRDSGDFDLRTQIAIAADALAACAALVGGTGVTILVERLNELDVPGSLVSTPVAAAALVETAGSAPRAAPGAAGSTNGTEVGPSAGAAPTQVRGSRPLHSCARQPDLCRGCGIPPASNAPVEPLLVCGLLRIVVGTSRRSPMSFACTRETQ